MIVKHTASSFDFVAMLCQPLTRTSILYDRLLACVVDTYRFVTTYIYYLRQYHHRMTCETSCTYSKLQPSLFMVMTATGMHPTTAALATLTTSTCHPAPRR